MTRDELEDEQRLPAKIALPKSSSTPILTGKLSTVSIKFRQACQKGERGRVARTRALEQAHDELLRQNWQRVNAPDSVGALVAALPDLIKEAKVAALTREQVLAALQAGNASPAVQRRAATELKRLTAPKRPGRKAKSKVERAPTLVLAAQLARDLIEALGARGENERGYVAEYAAEWASYVHSRGVRSQSVIDTLNRPRTRNFAI